MGLSDQTPDTTAQSQEDSEPSVSCQEGVDTVEEPDEGMDSGSETEDPESTQSNRVHSQTHIDEPPRNLGTTRGGRKIRGPI